MVTPQQLTLGALTVLLAGWAAFVLAELREWPLMFAAAAYGLVGAGHVAFLARRGESKMADVVVSWTFAGAVAFTLFAERIGADCK